MKIRTNYVSNSSSSSFIIWGDKAHDYVLKIEDGYKTDVDDLVYYLWNKKISKYYDYPNAIATFISDDEFMYKLSCDESLHNMLPESLREKGYYSEYMNDYKDVFLEWIYEHFKDEEIYFIDFSDHEDETKYHENEMYDVMSQYTGNGFCFFNH